MDVIEPIHRPSPVGTDSSAVPAASGSMWHVTVTVSGEPVASEEIRRALERLGEEHPFLLSGRYAVDRAEVRYWEEAADAGVATAMAAVLWDEHRESARLPTWRVVGVEVVDRDTFHRRGQRGQEFPGLIATGRVVPF